MGMSNDGGHFVVGVFLDNARAVLGEVDDNLVSKQCGQLFHREVAGLLDEEIDDDGADQAKAHVKNVHSVATIDLDELLRPL